MTRNDIYSLSDISKDAVATLSEPLTVRAFFSENLPAPYNNVRQQLRDLLQEYALHSNGFFSYSFETMEGEEKEETGEAARQYGIYPVQIESVEEDEFKAVSAYMGVAILHGDLVEVLPALTSTDQMELTLTETIIGLTRRISALVNLEDNIQVKLFLSSSLEERNTAFSDLIERVDDVVTNLSRQYYDRIDFARLDPSGDQAAAAQARQYRIAPIQLGAGEDGRTSEAYAAVIITNGAESYGGGLLIRAGAGYQLADIASIRTTVEGAVRSLLGLHEEIGYVADFDTPPYRGLSQQSARVEPELSRFYSVVSERYRFKGIRIAEQEIPETLGSLLVVQPKEPLTDWALYQIDQYLMKGGSLVVFLDPYFITIPRGPGGQPIGGASYTLRDVGLAPMLEHYGVRLPNAFVLDERSFVQRQQTPNGLIEQPVYFAPVIDKSAVNRELDFMSRLDDIVTLNVGPVEQADDPPAEVTIRPVFSSSDEAWILNTDPNLTPPTASQPPGPDERKAVPLAMLIEGNLESYFADKAVPAKPVSEDEGEESGDSDATIPGDIVTSAPLPLERGRGKIFVMGSSAVLGANVLGPNPGTPNSVFVQNVIDYMNDREEMAVMRSRGQRFSPIGEVEPGFRSFTKTFNIVVLPALVAVVGVVVWFLRTRRRNRIRKAFDSSTSERGETV
jgi:ABC-type uncharacterized transport system involved in gliding motility auxiliary subunit